jgi:hypothetical protein
MLNVIYAECCLCSVSQTNHYAECPYAEHRYAECHYAECHYAECHYAECHHAECHYAECGYAECRSAECHYAQCRYAECHYAKCRYADSRCSIFVAIKYFLIAKAMLKSSVHQFIHQKDLFGADCDKHQALNVTLND